MGKYIMSLDQGTTSSRCILFNHNAEVVSIAGKEFAQIFPKPGWVEHDPKEIWSSQLEVIKDALDQVKISISDIEAIGITNQRETTIIWDKNTGEPVYNAIVWQCRRTADIVESLKADGFDVYIKEKTGLIADAYFSATKIKWILDHVEGLREKAEKGDLLFGTVDTWLLWNLSGGQVFATDYTNASRTMLFDIHKLCWDDNILNRMEIPINMLPEVQSSSGIFGLTSKDVIGAEIPISGIAGDQQAALFGQCGFMPGSAKNTYGTGCFLLMNIGENPIQSHNGLITTIAATSGNKTIYALEGSVFVAGAAVQWLRDELKLIRHAAEAEEYANKVENTNGMYIVPAFTGMGAPYWEQYARGSIFGLTRGVTKEHFIRAVLESLAYQTYDVIKAMESDSKIELKELRVDGGASSNNFLMQFQSDILETKVVRPKQVETTALGAAYLAGLAVGFWKDEDEIKNKIIEQTNFNPNMITEEIEKNISGWHKAVKASIEWSRL